MLDDHLMAGAIPLNHRKTSGIVNLDCGTGLLAFREGVGDMCLVIVLSAGGPGRYSHRLISQGSSVIQFLHMRVLKNRCVGQQGIVGCSAAVIRIALGMQNRKSQ